MNPEPLRVLHVTDTHILSDPEAQVFGIDSFTALESLLAMVKRDTWEPHLLIATGDLSQDGSAASYRRLRSLLSALGIPVYCVPGNHDALSEMHANLKGGPVHIERRVVSDPWQIVLLDSQVPGEEHGFLSDSELAALEETLEQTPSQPTLVGLHHGPFPACPMPPCRLENADAFLAILGRHTQVRGVISGHNHCEVDERYSGIQMLVTPSTFLYADHPSGPDIPEGRPFEETHELDPGRRGVRRLELYPDGRIDTNVIWNNEGRPAETTNLQNLAKAWIREKCLAQREASHSRLATRIVTLTGTTKLATDSL